RIGEARAGRTRHDRWQQTARAAPARGAAGRPDERNGTMVDDDGKLSDFEKQALKERTAELRKQAGRKGGSKKEKDLQDVLDTIAGLPEPDKAIAQMIHEVVTEVAPELDPKTWYGFPAYARDGKVLVFYQQASKFDARYGTLGFQDNA